MSLEHESPEELFKGSSYAVSNPARRGRHVRHPPKIIPRAKKEAICALELDESLADAHTAMGTVLGQLEWDWQGAGREFRRAIELNPGSALAHIRYAFRCLIPLGRTGEGLDYVRRAQELDPLSVAINRDLGNALYFHRRYDEAIRQLRHASEMAPDFLLTRNLLEAVYSSAGMPEEALRQRQENFRQKHREPEVGELETAYAEAGERGVLQWSVERALPKAQRALKEDGGGNHAWNLARLYARLDEIDEAFCWLEEAVRQRGGFVMLTKVHPWLDSLRSDPRYAEILQELNLAE